MMRACVRCTAFALSASHQRRAIHRLQPSQSQAARLAPTDDTAIPLKPTWSVDELLASYTKPSISPEMLSRLHRLSALIPPVEGTPEHARLTRELEDLVKLVEAVRLADVPMDSAEDIPDGRIIAEDTHIPLDRIPQSTEDALPRDELLARAARTREGFYEISNDRVARS